MTPVTRDPVCVNTTSASPKPFPVVHHFPSMLAGAPVELTELLALAVLPVLLAADEFRSGVLAAVLALDFVVDLAAAAASEVILPPDACGCAKACELKTRYSTATVGINRR